MIDLFKKDIRVGDKVKLYLTTGKEPQGTVVSIGENYVLMHGDDNTENRFLDKIIGGWDIVATKIAPVKKIIDLTINEEGNRIEVDQKFLLDALIKFKLSLENKSLERFIHPNANIIEDRGSSFLASNETKPNILIQKNRIADERLLMALETLKTGSVVPVVLSYEEKYDKLIVYAASLPGTIEELLNSLIHFVESANYERADLFLSLLRFHIRFNKQLGDIIREFKKIKDSKRTKRTPKNTLNSTEEKKGKSVFKSTEKEVNDLIRQSKFEIALNQIEDELKKEIEEKYRSSLLLKKAQIYSSLDKPEASELAYEELVAFNEKINSSPNNLSHLYTELGRLQSLKIEKRTQAIQSVKRALDYNSNNNFASNLLKQLEGNNQKQKKEAKTVLLTADDQLLIETTDERTNISNMIDLDIKEHKYSHPEIIKNGGKPTTFIAELILKETKDSGGHKVTENYPFFIEAAKAFSELNVGSYELTNYLESVAYYSMLKGNSLFNQFKNGVIKGDTELVPLLRLNESATDYYIETLNIISNIDTKSLGSVLTNHLQLKIARYYLETGEKYEFAELFNTKFSTLFNSCIWSKEEKMKEIAFKAIIDIGSNSISMWNKLNDIFLNSNIKLKSIIEKSRNKTMINKVLNSNINEELNPVLFLKNAFGLRKKEIASFTEKTNKLLTIEFTPTNFRTIHSEWETIHEFTRLLQKTDKEIFSIIENIILNIQPYLSRTDKERGNILYVVIKNIENQLEFINQNTTFYGRTFFYRLLKKWRTEVDVLFEEKIAQSYPLLTVHIDPPYYIESNGEITAPLMIKNAGEATSEGYHLQITCESAVFDEKVEIPHESANEIPAGGKRELSFVIPKEILDESNAVEIRIEIEAVYQKNRLPTKCYEFTLEKEPVSFLKIEDIPWRTGTSTPQSLFVGREKLINTLFNHYRSVNKDKPYILYGLTRTGKSSILEYLRKKIDTTEIIIDKRNFKFISFEWEMQEIANNVNARDFYNDILNDRILNKLKIVLEKENNWDNAFEINEKGKFTDFKKILEFIKSKGYYPIFFVDEFSYIKDLMDRATIGSPFLAALREFSLSGLASFVFAGTYDIKKLISDERYGITGQLVHIIEYQVDKIAPNDAEALITIIDDKLSFTPEAIEYIKTLSGNIPYFVQIICKNCGDFAVENKRRVIGYPELEKVIQILTGELSTTDSILSRLPAGVFQNNQYSTTDPKEVEVLISTLCFFNKGVLNPRGIASHEIEKFWDAKGLLAFKSKLAVSFQSLMDRKILLDFLDEGIPVYTFSVDLFRRWWYVSHQDINLEISTLKEE